MKYKDYDFCLDSIPALNTPGGKAYHKGAVIDYLNHFDISASVILDAKIFLDTCPGFVHEDAILDALNAKEIQARLAREHAERQEAARLKKEQDFVRSFEKAFAVNIPELNIEGIPTVFIVPFNTDELPESLQNIPGKMSIQTLAGILNRVQYHVNGKAYAPEHTLDLESKQWLLESLYRNEIYEVDTARVTQPIVELSKSYIGIITQSLKSVNKLK